MARHVALWRGVAENNLIMLMRSLRAPVWRTIAGWIVLVGGLPASLAAPIHNYVFFASERARIHDAWFLRDTAFEGAQLKYTWRELEPAKGRYDFTAIRGDLTLLSANRKKLFVQIQDVTFTPVRSCVPDYLLHDPEFHGGANRQYNIARDSEATASVDGWVARRWDLAVESRFSKLLVALGHEFDGKVAGVNLAETAVDFGQTGRLFPPGFTPGKYLAGILDELAALKRAFPKSVTMIYANFMPGEWLPESDHHYLTSVYRAARALGVGFAGPDLLPYKPGQMAHSYPLIADAHWAVPTGIAVQEGNYEYIDPRSKKRITVLDQIRFARAYLKVGFIFWYPESPFFERDIKPTLDAQANSARISTTSR